MSATSSRAARRLKLPFRGERSRNGRPGRTLAVERLETRMPLDASGLAGIAAGELTLSFVPDGTDVAGHTSSLFADPEMQQIPDWQEIIAQAFQTWADLVQVPLRIVSDSGDPLGTLGAGHGDARFGDVRVAAVPLPSDTFAMSVPYADVVSGTWAGDLIFGSDAPIESAADLFSVALHEAGHVFGLGHSSDPSSPMYFHGISPVTAPTAEDIANLRKLLDVSGDSSETHSSDDEDDDEHGDDGEDREHNEDSQDDRSSSEQLVQTDSAFVPRNALHGSSFRVDGQLISRRDVDMIHLPPQQSADSDADVLTVQLRVADDEGFVPAVSVFTRDGQAVRTEILSNSGGLLVLQARGVDPRQSYTLRVKTADGPGVFNSGRYELEAQYTDRRTVLADLYGGQLTRDNASIQKTLTVRETGLVHLVLSVDTAEASNAAVVWVTISDQAGNVVEQIAATPGATRSAPDVLLPAGEYLVLFSAADALGETLPELRFALRGKGVSLPIGPRIIDPVRSPALPSSGGAGSIRPSRPADNLVISPVIYPGPGAVTAPQRPIVVRPPWSDPNWWYWSTTVVVAAP